MTDDGLITRRAGAREALLEAAAELFVEKGYEAVSTRELAERAGVNLGAIQYHFGSKAKLFVDTIHAMMQGSACVRGRLAIETVPGSRADAAIALGEFISSFMEYLLRPTGPQACRLMVREIFTRTPQDLEMYEALVSSVVKDFSAPLRDMLVSVLRVICPEMGDRELEFSAYSIIGQCTYYITHQPFIERLVEQNLSESPAFDEVVEHICRFSFAALHCEEEFIRETLAEMQERTSVCRKEKKDMCQGVKVWKQ